MTSGSRVAVATFAGASADHTDDRLLIEALGRRGVEAAPAIWDDNTVDWSAFDLVIVRSTWDYTARLEDFLGWVEAVAAVSALWNPAEVIRWNTHKSYLLDLEERGAPIVPTAWCQRGERVDLGDLLMRRGWSRAVVKPAVGASAEGLLVVEPHLVELAQHHLDRLLFRGDALIQPLLPTVSTEGEVSIVFVDGVFSHAFNKRPAPDAITTQPELGGTWTRIDPDPEVVSLAAWTLDTLARDLLYARVDLLADESGALHLVELELTEPSLFLEAAPGSGDRLAAGVVRRLEAR